MPSALRLFFWASTSGALLHTPPACTDSAFSSPPVRSYTPLCSTALHDLPPQGAITMLKYAISFALISLVTNALGFSGVAEGAAGIGLSRHAISEYHQIDELLESLKEI
jgi:hypothetical protein